MRARRLSPPPPRQKKQANSTTCRLSDVELVDVLPTANHNAEHRADLAALPADWRLVRVGANKAPIAGDGWFDHDNFSPDDALELNGSGPPAWGLKSGPESGVVVLDLDAEGWRESFEAETGHPITDLPRTIAWSSGKPGRSGRAFQVDPDWWPYLCNRRSWRNANGETAWELRGDRHQAVIIGRHPETGSYRWLPGCSPQDCPDPAPAPEWLLELLLVQELPHVEAITPAAGDANRAAAMLQVLPAADFTSYGDWLRIGMALHHTDAGLLAQWVDWCRQMPNFDEAECIRKWQSFGKGHKGRPATIATLHDLAKRYGYQEPRRKPVSKASVQPSTEGKTAKAKPVAASGHIRPISLEHHEIINLLPQRIGSPRLNIRTQDIHLPDRILSADEAALLYLQLSNPVEKWPKDATYDAVQLLAARGEFDPVAEYLEGLEASGTEPLPMAEWHRLDLMLLNIDDPVAAAFLPRFFISAVARTFEPGCPARQWPVLIGDKGIGKSDLPKLLFNIPNLPFGFIDSPGDLQRDGVLKCHRAWCVELAELDGISRRNDKAHMKAFLSERTDTVRKMWGRDHAPRPRRFVFWGTSNGSPINEADPRYVCINLPNRMLPFAAVEAARDHLWARAVQQYRAGVCWHTVSAEFRAMQDERNSDHTITDPWHETVADFLNRRKAAGDLPVTVPDLCDALKLDNSQRSNAVSIRLTELAAVLGWEKARRPLLPGGAKRQGFWPNES